MISKKRFAVIVNPAAGKGKTMRKLSVLKELAARIQSRFEYFITEKPYHAAHISDRIHKLYDGIIAFGGDGTANEVMNGLAGSDTPMGIIPIGTGNDFARSINVPKSIERALQIIHNYQTRIIDLGTIGERLFMNGVGIGFDGYVNLKSKSVKFFKGSLSYLYGIFSSLAFWKAIPMQIEIDDQLLPTKRSFLFAVGNGWSVGGGLILTPDALLDDQALDICHIADVPVGKILLNFGRLKTGTIGEVREVTLTKAKKIRIKSDYPLPTHFDGEFYQPLARELNIKIVPQSAVVIGAW